jgi:hypothetical protein
VMRGRWWEFGMLVLDMEDITGSRLSSA